jgi:hypothetical protein
MEEGAKIADIDRGRIGCIASLIVFVGTPASVILYVFIQMHFVPAYSAEGYIKEVGATVTARYYSAPLNNAGGQYVNVSRKGRSIAVHLEDMDWESNPKIDVYVTPEGEVSIHANVLFYTINLDTLKTEVSTLPSFYLWKLHGSFDFVGKRSFKYVQAN